MAKIVVTGAGGFIGSYLTKSLLRSRAAADLILVDYPETFNRACAKNFPSQCQRLDPEEFLLTLDRPSEISSIYHVGACSNTEELREDYLQKVNVDYSRSLWNFCVRQKIPYLYASSAATYGDGSSGFSDDPELIPQLSPLNPYGKSKQIFDLYVLEQLKKASTPPVWAGFKFFNVYGPGEEHKGSQASVAFHGRRQFLEKGYMKLFESDLEGIGHGEQKRDFVHIEDVAQVMHFFASGKGKNGIYNIGTGRARTFNELTQAIASALRVPHKIEYIPMPEHLKGRYQYFTQAELVNLRAAGYMAPMIDLFEGVKLYFDKFNS